MPTAVAKDLKAVDENQCRVWCRDRHRIEWTERPRGLRLKVEAFEGLCSAGDTWQMKAIQSYSGKPTTYRLEHMGKREWKRSGQFKIVSTALWATVAHVAGEERDVIFDCSHSHYPRRMSVAIGQKEATERHLASLPREIREAVDAPSMGYAVYTLTGEGWDFVTDNRIRCPRCQAEESDLVTKLAELAQLDVA